MYMLHAQRLRYLILIRRLALTASLFLIVFSAGPAHAVPQFARRYNVKCSACHTIVPVLNEQGALFKRLGYHLPPALMKGQPAPKMSFLVRSEPKWDLSNNASMAVTDFGFQSQRNTADGTPPSSTSAFQVNSWNMYAAGWIPDTQFFYYSEFDIVTDGVTSPELMNANFGYSGGNARHSWFVNGGRQHLQVAQGTRAAQVNSLALSAPLAFENSSPTNFVFDQSPVGLTGGYTWSSDGYKRVFAMTGKITNGDNADGSEILGSSNKNSKDLWADVDYWYAPESGISFVEYYGNKLQVQNSGAHDQFTYQPTIRRQGLFGNYMLDVGASKLDLLGGWMHAKDDWEITKGAADGFFRSNAFFAEADFYARPDLAVTARYDKIFQTEPDGPGRQSMRGWTAAVNKNLTAAGNIVARAGYSFTTGRDPSSAMKSTSSQYEADILFNF